MCLLVCVCVCVCTCVSSIPKLKVDTLNLIFTVHPPPLNFSIIDNSWHLLFVSNILCMHAYGCVLCLVCIPLSEFVNKGAVFS